MGDSRWLSVMVHDGWWDLGARGDSCDSKIGGHLGASKQTTKKVRKNLDVISSKKKEKRVNTNSEP